jgi:hypothetical protein
LFVAPEGSKAKQSIKENEYFFHAKGQNVATIPCLYIPTIISHHGL